MLKLSIYFNNLCNKVPNVKYKMMMLVQTKQIHILDTYISKILLITDFVGVEFIRSQVYLSSTRNINDINLIAD